VLTPFAIFEYSDKAFIKGVVLSLNLEKPFFTVSPCSSKPFAKNTLSFTA